MRVARHPWKTALAAALGVGMALSCGSAHGGTSHRLAVSATILPRIACRLTNETLSQLGSGGVAAGSAAVVSASLGKALGCAGSDAATAYRVRSNRGPHPNGTVVLTVEP